MTLIWHPDQGQTMDISLLKRCYNWLPNNHITNYRWDECWYGYKVAAIIILLVHITFLGYKLPQDVWSPAMEEVIWLFKIYNASNY